MKPVAMFVLGAVLAAGVVYFGTRPKEEPAPPAQTAQTAVPARAPVVEPAPTALETPAPVKPSAMGPLAGSKPAPKRKEPAVIARTSPPAQPTASSPSQSAPQSTPSAPAVAPERTPEPETPRQGLSIPAPSAGPGQIERKAQTATIPAGTLLTVRIDQSLSSEDNQEGDTFRATLDQPLVVDGFVLAERGARAEGKVAQIERSGRVKGLAQLGLQLTSVRGSDGQTIRLQTDSFSKQAETSKKGDAAKVGAAAGLGAAIGAIAGGGKGAAIGAVVGAGAGTGGVMATRGEPARIPAETRVSFKLSSPVTVTERLR